MTRRAIPVLLLGSLCALGAVSARLAAAEEKKVIPLLNHTMKDIDGKDVPLAKYQGKVLMLVNVASYCGNTQQYAPLQALYEKYRSRGFVVLGFPANEFGKQEPGTDAEIKTFCTTKYHVTFPMFSKIVVKGEGQHPLYKQLTDKTTNPQFGGEVEWNFAKFLVNRQGDVVARFPARKNPGDADLVAAIERELAAK